MREYLTDTPKESFDWSCNQRPKNRSCEVQILCLKFSQKYILKYSQRIEVVSIALTILSFPGPFLKKAEISSSFFGRKRRGRERKCFSANYRSNNTGLNADVLGHRFILSACDGGKNGCNEAISNVPTLHINPHTPSAPKNRNLGSWLQQKMFCLMRFPLLHSASSLAFR